jgi:hypothetical protein
MKSHSIRWFVVVPAFLLVGCLVSAGCDTTHSLCFVNHSDRTAGVSIGGEAIVADPGSSASTSGIQAGTQYWFVAVYSDLGFIEWSDSGEIEYNTSMYCEITGSTSTGYSVSWY